MKAPTLAGLERDFQRDVWCFLGLPFDVETVETACAFVEEAVASREQAVIATPNVNWVTLAFREPPMQEATLQSDLSLMDGQPLVWMARWIGLPFRTTASGSTLIDHFLKTRLHRGYRLFFLGGKRGVAEEAVQHVNRLGCKTSAVGGLNPGYGSIQEMSRRDVLSGINASRCDLLLVALGVQRGVLWIEKNHVSLNAAVISPIGSGVNLIAGRLKRAPRWMQQAGLEWFWRILHEPFLLQRYLKDGLIFLYLLCRYLLPLAGFRLFFKRRSSEAPQIHVEEGEDVLRIRIKGVCDENSRPLMREVFRDWARKEKDLLIDFSETIFVDASFLGFLLLLWKYQKIHQKGLTLIHLSAPLRLFLHLNLLDRLFKGTAVSEELEAAWTGPSFFP